MVREFLEKHHVGTNIEFGVGLDMKFDRLENGVVTGIELDPNVGRVVIARIRQIFKIIELT